MAPIQHLYGSAYDNILRDATMGGTTPSTSYSLATMNTMNPADRVRFGSGSCTITWTLATSKTGGVLILPISNADAGSGVVSLTNGAGLNVAVPIPAPYRTGHARTVMLDFSLAGSLTSNSWTLHFSGNSAPVIIGAAVGIFPKQVLPGLRFEFSYAKKYAVSDEPNEYLTRYRFNYRAHERTLNGVIWTPGSSLSVIEDLFDGGNGSAEPGFLAPQLPGIDPCFGTWPDTFNPSRVGDTDEFSIPLVIRELAKGKPVF